MTLSRPQRLTAVLWTLALALGAVYLPACHRGPAPAPSATAAPKMGTAHAPSAQVQVNSTSLGAWTRTDIGAVHVAAGETVSLKLSDTSGCSTWVLSAAGKDDQVVFPAITQAGTPAGTATFVAPSSPGTGWSILVRSQVGAPSLGRDINGAVLPSATYQFILYLQTAGGSRVIAANESTEGDPAGAGWATPINAIIRAGGASGSPTGAAAGDWTGSFPAGTNVKINGLRVPWKAGVRVAATSAITLSGTQTIDGVALSAGDTVLVTAQASASANGKYVVASGAWSRVGDFAASADALASSAIAVSEGGKWGNTVWTMGTQGSVTLGTTALTFTPDRAQSVADLRTVSGKTAGQRVRLLSYQTLGDRGDGEVYWDATSTAAEDGCLTFRPTGVTTGIWSRLYTESIPVTWCGAGHNVASQDTAAIQADFNIVSNLDGTRHSRRVVFPDLNGSAGGYLINATLVLQGSTTQSVTLEGEASQEGPGAFSTRLFWAGANSFSGPMLDIRGGFGVTIRNLSIDQRAQAMYGVKIAYDLTNGIGANAIAFEHDAFLSPRNVAGSANVSLGDTGGNQTDTIRFSDCVFQDELNGSNTSNVCAAIKTQGGSNSKFFQFSRCTFGGYKYAYDFSLGASGPIAMFANSFAGIFGSVIYGTNMRVSMDSCYAEGINQLILSDNNAQTPGSISIRDSEAFLAPNGTNDFGIDWVNGSLAIDGCSFSNGRLLTVTGATNATPIVITAVGHGLTTGDREEEDQVVGNTAANGFFRVTVVDADHFSLQDAVTGANIAGNGAYVSGGRVQPEFKFRIQTQDPALVGGVLVDSSITIERTKLGSSKFYPMVRDPSGNELFSPTYALSGSFPLRVASIKNAYVALGTSATTQMLDIVGATPTSLLAQSQTLTNHTDLRTLDENDAGPAQLAQFLGTLAKDMKAAGLRK